MSEYTDILNTAWDNIPEPKVLPVGSYELKLSNASVQEGKGDKSDSILFVYTPVSPMDDVDDEALEELGPDYDFSANRIFARFWVSDGRDMATVRSHCAKHGIDPSDYTTVGETLKGMRGTSVIAYLKQRSYVNNAQESVLENTPSNFQPVG